LCAAQRRTTLKIVDRRRRIVGRLRWRKEAILADSQQNVARHRAGDQAATGDPGGARPSGAVAFIRGFRPLTVVTLCCVVAVVSVLLTRTLAMPAGSSGRGGNPVVGAGPVDVDPGADSGTEASTEPDDESESTEPPADGGSGGSAPTAPATHTTDPNTQPAPPPPAPPAPPAPPPPPTLPSPTPSPSPAPPPPIWYEAESPANTRPGTRLFTCGGCSGDRKVGDIGKGMGTLQFNGVTATRAGQVVLTIAYVNGDSTSRTAKLSVNGATGISLTFGRTGGWSTVGIVVVTITVRAGANTLKFYNTTGPAPDFDRIMITAAA
jgi:hypothetical protein